MHRLTEFLWASGACSCWLRAPHFPQDVDTEIHCARTTASPQLHMALRHSRSLAQEPSPTPPALQSLSVWPCPTVWPLYSILYSVIRAILETHVSDKGTSLLKTFPQFLSPSRYVKLFSVTFKVFVCGHHFPPSCLTSPLEPVQKQKRVSFAKRMLNPEPQRPLLFEHFWSSSPSSFWTRLTHHLLEILTTLT